MVQKEGGSGKGPSGQASSHVQQRTAEVRPGARVHGSLGVQSLLPGPEPAGRETGRVGEGF